MEVYATAISMNSIFFKCPFNVKQGMHVIANDNHNLRSRIEHNTIVECDAGCEHVVNVHITDDTERVLLVPNKNNTRQLAPSFYCSVASARVAQAEGGGQVGNQRQQARCGAFHVVCV